MTVLERLGGWLWNPWLLGLFLLSGLYFSIKSGFFQIFGVKKWLGGTVGQLLGGKQKGTGRGLTRFQAMSPALASPSSTAGRGRCSGCGCPPFWA